MECKSKEKEHIIKTWDPMIFVKLQTAVKIR